MKSLRIAIIHPWDRAKWNEPIIWDGLHGALKEVAKTHQVDWFLEGDNPNDSYDWIIPWGVMSIPFNSTIEKFRGRKAIFCAGHPQDIANINKFEAIFVESPAVQQQMSKHHPKVILAFGTDIEFFKPTDTPKMFDAFYPATYSPWKRQDLFALGTQGYKALSCGVIQPDGQELYNLCNQISGYVMGGLVPTFVVASLYNASKTVVITSWHGSERTVLEAMATNIPLVLTKDNVLAASLVSDEVILVDPNPMAIRAGFMEAITKKVNTRQYLIDKGLTHINYAKQILSVIEN